MAKVLFGSEQGSILDERFVLLLAVNLKAFSSKYTVANQ